MTVGPSQPVKGKAISFLSGCLAQPPHHHHHPNSSTFPLSFPPVFAFHTKTRLFRWLQENSLSQTYYDLFKKKKKIVAELNRPLREWTTATTPHLLQFFSAPQKRCGKTHLTWREGKEVAIKATPICGRRDIDFCTTAKRYGFFLGNLIWKVFRYRFSFLLSPTVVSTHCPDLIS